MTDKLFDTFIQQKLYHKESSVPADLWDKIAAEKNKKRGFFWWKNPKIYLPILTGIVILTAITISSKFSNTETKVLVINNKNVSEGNKANESNFATQQLKYNENDNINNPTSNIKINTDNKTINPSVQTKNSYAKSVKKTVSNNAVVSIENRKNAVKEIKEKSSDNFNQSNGISLLNTSTSFNNDASNLDYKNYVRKSKNAANTIAKVGFNYEEALQQNNATANNIDLQFLTKSGKQLFSANTAPPIINLRKIFGLDDCPTANGHQRNDWYLEGYGSIDYTSKRVENISTTDAYLAKKDSAEKMKGGFTLGVRISKSLSDNMLFKTGFQFNQMFEQFKLSVENERRITTTIITRTLIRTGLPDTTISDTTSLIQIGYRTQQNTNLYRSIELPLLLSYEFGKPDSKFSFALTAGAIINLTTWNKGNTINELNQIVSINSKPPQTSFYRNQIGLSAYLSASVIKQVNNKWAFFAEPYIRYSLGKNNLASGFVQQFDAIGINFGTRLKINR